MPAVKEGRVSRIYDSIIEEIFHKYYRRGAVVVPFERSELIQAARRLRISLPKNPGDVVYSYKYRKELPAPIASKAPPGKQWVIVSKGRSKYAFEARNISRILPDTMLVVTKIPDATPGIVAKYALGDEQALLTKLRYNRLIDIFSGVVCYSLQNHLRTTVPGVGQVETDELYVGIDKKGVHYVFPIQAKGGHDDVGVVQIEQDIALCKHRFPGLVCRAIAAQFMAEDVIAMFELDLQEGAICKVAERHYQLVAPEEVGDEDLQRYRSKGTH